MAVLIRRATEDDLMPLLKLYQQLSLDGPREDLGPPLPPGYAEAFSFIEADSRQHLLVAELEGKIVGSLVLVIVPNLSHRGSPWSEIENMVVDEAVRGQQIGKELVDAAIDIARKAGCYKLTLTSNSRRSEAHRFYERLGFKTTHRAFRMDL